MSKSDKSSGDSEWKVSESTSRMARIMGVEFQTHRSWTTSSKQERDDLKRA